MELTEENILKIIEKYTPEVAAGVISGFIRVNLIPLESELRLLRYEKEVNEKLINNLKFNNHEKRTN